MARRKRRTGKRRGGLLALLLALAALLGLHLSGWFPGLLPGGGSRPDADRSRADDSGARRLHLSVLDPGTLSPIEGARIRLEDGAGTGAALRAGRDGRIALPAGDGTGPPAPDDAWQVLGRGARGEGVRVGSRAWSGRVTDAAGAPLAAAELRAVDGAGRPRGRTRADAEGRFVLRADPVDAARPPLEPGPRLAGRLAGAGPGTLEVYALVPSPDRDGLLALATTWELDAEGRYAGTPPAGARAWGVFEGRPVALRGGDQPLPAAATAGGVVRGPGGEPVPGAWLRFAPWLDPVWEAERPVREAGTDAQGRFAVGGLARVRYHVTVGAPGLATRILDEVEVGDAPLELELGPGFGITGVVVDAGGRPAPGVTVRARGLPDPRAERPRAVAATDASGRFALEGLGGEHAELHVEVPGAAPWFFGRAGPGADVRVVLPR